MAFLLALNSINSTHSFILSHPIPLYPPFPLLPRSTDPSSSFSSFHYSNSSIYHLLFSPSQIYHRYHLSFSSLLQSVVTIPPDLIFSEVERFIGHSLHLPMFGSSTGSPSLPPSLRTGFNLSSLLCITWGSTHHPSSSDNNPIQIPTYIPQNYSPSTHLHTNYLGTLTTYVPLLQTIIHTVKIITQFTHHYTNP